MAHEEWIPRANILSNLIWEAKSLNSTSKALIAPVQFQMCLAKPIGRQDQIQIKLNI